jgi:hypothetical protein
VPPLDPAAQRALEALTSALQGDDPLVLLAARRTGVRPRPAVAERAGASKASWPPAVPTARSRWPESRQQIACCRRRRGPTCSAWTAASMTASPSARYRATQPRDTPYARATSPGCGPGDNSGDDQARLRHPPTLTAQAFLCLVTPHSHVLRFGTAPAAKEVQVRGPETGDGGRAFIVLTAVARGIGPHVAAVGPRWHLHAGGS